MGRIYRLSKKVSDKEASEILREIRELSDVEDAEFVEETSGLKVITKDNQFLDVMSAAVNICNESQMDLNSALPDSAVYLC